MNVHTQQCEVCRRNLGRESREGLVERRGGWVIESYYYGNDREEWRMGCEAVSDRISQESSLLIGPSRSCSSQRLVDRAWRSRSLYETRKSTTRQPMQRRSPLTAYLCIRLATLNPLFSQFVIFLSYLSQSRSLNSLQFITIKIYHFGREMFQHSPELFSLSYFSRPLSSSNNIEISVERRLGL